jgi:uncharacterized OsmC-like protein
MITAASPFRLSGGDAESANRVSRAMQEIASSPVKQRQDPLCARYRGTASDALITDGARTINNCTGDPFHGAVVIGAENGVPWRFGIHPAVGGYHDLPNPGDLLCAALSSCLDATLRMIADRLGIGLESLDVTTAADCDVRGALLVDRRVPVGFQRVECRVRLRAPDGDAARLPMLVAAAEHSCVVLQTLRGGIAVRVHLEQ